MLESFVLAIVDVVDTVLEDEGVVGVVGTTAEGIVVAVVEFELVVVDTLEVVFPIVFTAVSISTRLPCKTGDV